MSHNPSDDRRTVAGLPFDVLIAGGIGGTLVVGVVMLVLALAGVLKSSTTTTIAVEERAVSPATGPQQEYGLAVGQVYQRDAPGVVFVNASGVTAVQSAGEYLKGEGGEQATATGSGVEIDGSGNILTNWHVVEGAAKIAVGSEHGATVKAQLVGKDPSEDLALLRIPIAGLTLHPLSLGDSSAVKVGDEVLAIGNPFGLGGTLTAGVVSALERQIQAPNGVKISNVLQTDAPINPDNSGGPLLNTAGEVIGINSQIVTGGDRGGSVGIAFAIPVNNAKSELSTLEKVASCMAPRVESKLVDRVQAAARLSRGGSHRGFRWMRGGCRLRGPQAGSGAIASSTGDGYASRSAAPDIRPYRREAGRERLCPGVDNRKTAARVTQGYGDWRPSPDESHVDAARVGGVATGGLWLRQARTRRRIRPMPTGAV
jgi:S1-C subfamily serine protease